MSYQFGNLILPCKKPELIYDFLSFIFDLENFEGATQDEIHLSLFGINLKLRKQENENVLNVPFELTTHDAAGLFQLKQNIEFYYYKNQSDIPEINVNDDRIEFLDPEGHCWKVLLVSPLIVSSRVPEKNTQDVRIC